MKNVDRNAIYRKYSGLPKYARRPLVSVARDYVERFDQICASGRDWLAFFGRSGHGKTTQAYGVADALLSRPDPVRVRVFRYDKLIRELTALRYDANAFQALWSRAVDVELLVLDDFLDVPPRENSFEERCGVELIKRLYEDRTPLVLTSEHTPQEMTRLFAARGEAILGRVVEMCAGRLRVAAADAPNYRTLELKQVPRYLGMRKETNYANFC